MGPCVGDMWSDKICILCNVNDMKLFFKTKVIRIRRGVKNICCYNLSYLTIFFHNDIVFCEENNKYPQRPYKINVCHIVINMSQQFR